MSTRLDDMLDMYLEYAEWCDCGLCGELDDVQALDARVLDELHDEIDRLYVRYRRRLPDATLAAIDAALCEGADAPAVPVLMPVEAELCRALGMLAHAQYWLVAQRLVKPPERQATSAVLSLIDGGVWPPRQ